MLYDQGQLLKTFADAYSVSSNPLYSHVCHEIIEYCLGNLYDKDSGAFFSAEDADSLASHESTKKSEGAFAVFTGEELKTILKEESPIFMYMYGCEENGNVDPTLDPHGELTKKVSKIRIESK